MLILKYVKDDVTCFDWWGKPLVLHQNLILKEKCIGCAMKSLKRDKNVTKKNMQPHLSILFFGHPVASN